MFSIRITDEPLIEIEQGEKGRVGVLVLGNHEERFVAHTWTCQNMNMLANGKGH